MEELPRKQNEDDHYCCHLIGIISLELDCAKLDNTRKYLEVSIVWNFPKWEYSKYREV